MGGVGNSTLNYQQSAQLNETNNKTTNNVLYEFLKNKHLSANDYSTV